MAGAAPAARSDPARLRAFVEAAAASAGFGAVGVCAADAAGSLPGERLRDFIALGRHGTMDWLAERLAERARPQGLWSGARSVIVLGMNYGPDDDPLPDLERREAGYISVYARNRDYHDVVKGKLKEVAGKLAARAGADVKVFVDTAPVMEKPLAQAAGVGWQGKHTNLVSREFGSWLFLGSIFTTADIAPDEAEADHCGSCRACLDICPTAAFPAPYQLDARRCISYLTIEHKGPIPVEFRAAMGNRIYGCDDCVAVCPWNKFARQASEAKLAARGDRAAPPLARLLSLDDAGFRAAFAGSPIKRIGRDRFVRNCLIAAGNSGEAALVAPCRALLDDAAPVVRGAAVWALSRLTDLPRWRETAGRAAAEDNADVLAEWRRAGVGAARTEAVSA